LNFRIMSSTRFSTCFTPLSKYVGLSSVGPPPRLMTIQLLVSATISGFGV
jgi:hypothetical protein